MRSDRAGFFVKVLHDHTFVQRGLLFGSELVSGLPLHWAVVDPSRYAMYVWQKQEPSLVTSALSLDSPLYTNGPFSTTRIAH